MPIRIIDIIITNIIILFFEVIKDIAEAEKTLPWASNRLFFIIFSSIFCIFAIYPKNLPITNPSDADSTTKIKYGSTKSTRRQVNLVPSEMVVGLEQERPLLAVSISVLKRLINNIPETKNIIATITAIPVV
jgi:hypothetical protein